jgi:hypothetical protein
MTVLQIGQFQSQEIEKNKYKLNIFKILPLTLPLSHQGGGLRRELSRTEGAWGRKGG